MRQPMRALGIAAGSMNLGVDQARPDPGDADAFACDLLRKADREGIYRSFRRGVIDIRIGAPKLGCRRRQIDDHTTLAAMLGRHPLHRLARAKDVTRDIDRHHALDAFDAHFVDAHATPADNAAIVDQRAERSEFVAGLEQTEDLALLGDIAFRRDGLAVGALDDRNHFICGRLVAGIADHDPKAALGRRNSGGAADAAATAGDDRYPVGQNLPPFNPAFAPLRGVFKVRFTNPAPAAPDLPGSP